MAEHANGDQFVMIRVDGMHCHRCQETIRRALEAHEGVHEVEVDFPSGLASVLYDPKSVRIRQLVDTIVEAGYTTTGFTQGRAPDHPLH